MDNQVAVTEPTAELDDFTRAYIEAALWSSTLDPFGTCPSCEQDDKILCRWDTDGTPVCTDCSSREPNYEPPADDNYSVADIAPETLAVMVADCQRFQADNAEWITDENVTHGTARYTADEYAGHDFWLTRCGHGCGYWDGDWTEPVASKLTEASKRFGEVNLYVGDDGRIYA